MMRKTTAFAALPIAALLAAGSSVLSADEGKVPSASEFAPIERYGITYDEPRDMAEFYLREYGLKLRHADIEELDHPTDATMRVMLVTVNGIRSDSLNGVQFRLGIRANRGSWETAEAGMRRKCNRGESMGEWTKAVCPSS